MVVTIPPGIKAEGKSSVLYVPTLTSPAAPTTAEVTGASALDLSFFLTAGSFKAAGEQAKGDDRRYGSKQTFQTLGRTTHTIDDIVYISDPQAAASAPTNEAMETLAEGITGYLIVRWGLDAESAAFAATQKVDVYPVEFGSQNKTPLGDNDEFAKITITQGVAVTGLVRKQVAIAA